MTRPVCWTIKEVFGQVWVVEISTVQNLGLSLADLVSIKRIVRFVWVHYWIRTISFFVPKCGSHPYVP